MRSNKRFILLYILIFGTLPFVLGQRLITEESQADSLREIIEKKNTADISKALNVLAAYIYTENPDRGKVLAKKALQNASENNNTKEQSFAYNNLGNIYQSLNNYDTAFGYYIKAEKLFNQIGEEKELLSVYNNLALMHKNMNQLDLALDNLLKMQKLVKTMKVSARTKTALYSNLAGIYYLQDKTELGMQYLDSASKNINQLEDPYVKGLIYNNLGKFFSEIERYDKALSLLKKSIDLFEQLENQQALAMIYENLGEVYEKIYNYQRAEAFYRQAYDIYKELDDSLGIAGSKEHIGVLLSLRKDFIAGREQLQEAFEIYKDKNDGPGMAKVIISIAESYTQQGNYTGALNYLETHQKIVFDADRKSLREDHYRIKMNAYSALNRHAEALVASKKFYAIRDSLQETRNKANMNILKQELKLTKDMLREQMISGNEQNNFKSGLSALWFYLTVALLLLLLALLIFMMQKQKKKNITISKRLSGKEKELAALNKRALDFDRKVEELVAQRTKDYEEQIQQLKKKDNKLKKTLKEVEDANYLKNAFLSNMSHEIRTPLNGIIGFASLLETELSLLENEELYGYANGIQQSGERLLHLLNNIIDISRIEANDLQVSIQETNLNQIIEKSSELFKFQANEKNLALNIRLQETPMVYADPDSVSKIISDIIDNAVKYTEKGFINITNGYDQEKKEVFVKVKDTGIGIDQNYLPKVFEAFRQESLGYSRAFQGAGLGLPLAKRLLDLLNGRIDIESKKQEGTVVSVYLPTKETFKHVNESLHPTKKLGKEPIPLKKPIDKTHIFLVEDDRMNRLVITKMLTDWNMESAEDGDITIEKIEKAYNKGHIFDLMLFDINLPNPWDGIKLMHYIKKKFPEYKDIPFIAQTAYAMRGDKERLLDEGFDDYLSKPISQQRLLTTVYRFLRKQDEA